MSDWRYSVVHEGIVEATDEKDARLAAIEHAELHFPASVDVERVEEVGEGE